MFKWDETESLRPIDGAKSDRSLVDKASRESDELSDIFKDTYEMTSYPFQLNQLAGDDSFDMLVLITSKTNGNFLENFENFCEF